MSGDGFPRILRDETTKNLSPGGAPEAVCEPVFIPAGDKAGIPLLLPLRAYSLQQIVQADGVPALVI